MTFSVLYILYMDDISSHHGRSSQDPENKHDSLSDRRPSGRLVCLECGMSYRGRAAPPTCHANWKMIPNANIHCAKHGAVCVCVCM